MMIADILMLIHFTFIAFIVGGQSLIIIGYHRKWRRLANLVMPRLHIASVLYVVVQVWAGQWCPLTLLENRYRQTAGQETYRSSFIQDWVGRAIYYDAPQWMFKIIYTVFGAVALIYWLLLERQRLSEE